MTTETAPVGTLPPGSDFKMSERGLTHRVQRHVESYVEVSPTVGARRRILLHEDDLVIPIIRRPWWWRLP